MRRSSAEHREAVAGHPADGQVIDLVHHEGERAARPGVAWGKPCPRREVTLRRSTAPIGLLLLLVPAGTAAQTSGRAPSPPIRIMHGHVRAGGQHIGSIRSLRDRGALGRIVDGHLRASGRLSVGSPVPGRGLASGGAGGRGFHSGGRFFHPGVRVGANGILLFGGAHGDDPFGLRKPRRFLGASLVSFHGFILPGRIRSIRVDRAISPEAAIRSRDPGWDPGTLGPGRERPHEEVVMEREPGEPPVCAEARIRAAAETELRLRIDARRLGAGSAAEAERALRQRLRRGDVLELEGLEGGRLAVPAALVRDVVVLPCSDES